MKRIGQRTLEFSAPPTVLGHAAIGGKKEAQGPLGQDFDQTFQDTSLQMESWEKAEAQLQKEAVALASAFLPPLAFWIFKFPFWASMEPAPLWRKRCLWPLSWWKAGRRNGRWL